MENESEHSAEPRQIRVVVVDDHALFRRGAAKLLEGEGMQVVAEARSGEEAVELATRLGPDVVLMDLHMPGQGGVQAARQLAERGTAVLMLTASADAEDVDAAVHAGARGYLLKDGPIDEMIGAIRAAARGDAWLSPAVAGKLLRRVREAGQAPAGAPEEVELTDRELEVLRLLAEGRENAEIGRELHLSSSTVKSHVSSILDKLGIDNRVQAAVYAARRGLV